MSENGNRDPCFGQATLEHLDALYGFAMVLTRDQTEAADLVQETYLRAVRAFGRLMPDSNLKGWLFTIMRNVGSTSFATGVRDLYSSHSSASTIGETALMAQAPIHILLTSKRSSAKRF